MPFTPFHFGPAVLFKAAAPARLSLTAFIATQVAVDCEVLWRAAHHQSPLHGVWHTGIAAAGVGLAVGTAIHLAAKVLPASIREQAGPSGRAEWNWTGALSGGALGGVTHSLLDATMNCDIQPFWPLLSGNPLRAPVGPAVVPCLCVIAGVGSVIWMLERWSRRGGAG
jgi:hypothetical protein